MPVCTFNQPFTGSADDLVTKIQTQVQDNGGTFAGDSSSGSFSVPVLGSSVSGTYSISGQDIRIDIDHKPFFASCGAIGNFISHHIS